jgi:hypothetical protein
LPQVSSRKLRNSLHQLQAIRGESLAVFPQDSILRVDDKSGHSQYFTLVNNSGFSNISELFGEDKRRRPAEDYLTVVPGILGAYPNAFFRVTETQLGPFAEAISRMKTTEDYTRLADRYAVRRTDPQFWAFSDALHEDYRKREPVTAGMLDYNRLENR